MSFESLQIATYTRAKDYRLKQKLAIKINLNTNYNDTY